MEPTKSLDIRAHKAKGCWARFFNKKLPTTVCAGSEACASAAAISEWPSGGLFGVAGGAVPGATYHKARTKPYADTILLLSVFACALGRETKRTRPRGRLPQDRIQRLDKLSHKRHSSISITQSSGWRNMMTRRSSSPEQPGVRFRAARLTLAAAMAASAVRKVKC